MPVLTEELRFKTRGNSDVADLTERVAGAVSQSGVREGAAIVFVPGSTAGITTIELEPGLVTDIKAAIERLVPASLRYSHNRGGETNGHAHVRASIIGPSVAVPIVGGRLALGTWQQIVLIDFDDRPRARMVLVQVIGES